MSDSAEYESSARTRLIKVFKVDTRDFRVPASVISIDGGDSKYSSAFYPCSQNLRTVTFETGSKVTTLGGYLFSETKLETIDMTPCTELKKLSYAMFFKCKNIKSVILPPNLEVVTKLSFAESSIASLNLPDTTLTIEAIEDGIGVFMKCYSFTTLNIQKTSQLKTIGAHAFMQSGLESIFIPAATQRIEGGVFIHTHLNNIVVDPSNTVFSTDGYVLFKNNMIIATKVLDTREYTIKEDVTFGNQAFRSARFSKISFAGNKNYYLPAFCFSDTKFTTIELPDLIETIPSTCFGYSSLETIILPKSCKTLDFNAFVDCKNLRNVTLPEGLLTVGSAVFSGDTKLLYIEIPYSVQNFGQGVFKSCDKDIVVIFKNTDRFKIKDYLLINNGTVIVEYLGTDPNYDVVIPEPCTLIGITLFSGAAFKSLRFANPSSSAIFKDKAFIYSLVQEVFCPSGLEYISPNCFEGCSKLRSITLAGTLSSIPVNCFINCVALETVIVNSNSIKKIERKAFLNTPNLINFDLACMELLTIEANAFERSGIQTVRLPTTLTSVAERAFFSSGAKSLIVESSTITVLPGYLMSNSKQLESVNLGTKIEKIDLNCFENCTALTNIEISAATSRIEMYAFAGCTSLEYITIPDKSNLTRIMPFCFDRCTSFNRFEIKDTEKFYFDSVVLMNAAKTQIIFYIPVSKSKSFVVPGTVTSINGYAFHTCNFLREVIIPDGVIKDIGVDAFRDCKNLRRIVLPKSLETIGEDAFAGCNKLECGSVTMENKPELLLEARNAKIPESVIAENCLNDQDFVWFGHFKPSIRNVCFGFRQSFVATLILSILG